MINRPTTRELMREELVRRGKITAPTAEVLPATPVETTTLVCPKCGARERYVTAFLTDALIERWQGKHAHLFSERLACAVIFGLVLAFLIYLIFG